MNNKMKRIIILAALAVMAIGESVAQQVPMYSSYYYNQFLYNPALAGNSNCGNLFLVNRNQWNSIPGAPRTTALTVDGPLRNENIGLGLAVFRDQAGIFNITGGQAAYRYGLKIDDNQTLNFGLGLGVLNNQLRLQDIVIKDPLDPNVQRAFENAVGFDANIGINYNYKTFNIGVTVPQIIGNELAYETIQNPIAGSPVRYGMVQHFIAHTSYEWDIKDDGRFFLTPMFMARVTPGAPFQFDANVMFSYMKKYWIGAMYRSQYAMTLSGGLRLADQISVGYAYDLAVHNTLSNYTRGAHEVMVGYKFGCRGQEDPELKKKLKDINDRITNNDEEIDSLGNEVKKNRDDIDNNKEEIEDNDGELDEIRAKIKTFDDFIKDFKDGKLKPGSGVSGGTGSVYTFNNVYFETNKWDINGGAVDELNNLATILKDNPGLKIEVAGHADNRGSDSYNRWLSNKRAVSVRDYLIRKGVSASQLEVKSYGEGDPAGDELSQNRRVEFKILEQ
jgi:type IX secretion system PorP/SprF family membrane protein